MNGTYVDIAGALAMAEALGVERSTAASLIAACSRGLALGTAERRQKEAEGAPEGADS